MFHKCKITVVKRLANKDLIDKYVTNLKIFPICNKVEKKQEFFVATPFEMSEGICCFGLD